MKTLNSVRTRCGLILSLGFVPLALITPSAPQIRAATIVDVDATTLTDSDGTAVPSIANAGNAGLFTTVTGTVLVGSRPSMNNPEASVKGMEFDGISKMTAAVLAPDVGLSGNQAHTVRAWVWNPEFGSEEAIVAWGRRGGPDGTNLAFHQGNHDEFGAVGHWGDPDVPWGGGGTDSNVTLSRWANLAYVFDGTESRVYIDGVLNNSIAHGALNVHAEENPISIGSENELNNPVAAPKGFSGTIARVQVFDTAMTDKEILAAFEAERALFEDGVGGTGAVFEIVEIGHNAKDGSVTFTWQSRPNKTYAIDFSTDMETFVELNDGVPGEEGSTTTYTDLDQAPLNPERLFYVVREV